MSHHWMPFNNHPACPQGYTTEAGGYRARVFFEGGSWRFIGVRRAPNPGLERTRVANRRCSSRFAAQAEAEAWLDKMSAGEGIAPVARAPVAKAPTC